MFFVVDLSKNITELVEVIICQYIMISKCHVNFWTPSSCLTVNIWIHIWTKMLRDRHA